MPLFFENTPYFSAYLGSITTPSTTYVTLLVPLEYSSPLQLYQRRTKITTDLNSLPPHQSTASTEVFELLIGLREGTRSCTQHPIDKVSSFSHLSPPEPHNQRTEIYTSYEDFHGKIHF